MITPKVYLSKMRKCDDRTVQTLYNVKIKLPFYKSVSDAY